MAEFIDGGDFEVEFKTEFGLPKWCQYCESYGAWGKWNACYNIPKLRLIFHGPKIVSYCDTCHKHNFHKEFGSKKR